MPGALDHRCGTCARFVRVVERTSASTGEVKREGQCALGVWPSPLYETSTCGEWVGRGQLEVRRPAAPRLAARRSRSAGSSPHAERPRVPLSLPEDLLDMDEEAFRRVLTEVLRDELGMGETSLAGKWEGGEMVLRPGKPGLQEKAVPIENLFHKVIMIRDRLRVLEQKINGHPKLGADDKVQMQQYLTACYGSLTTFNVLFAEKGDQFVGQKGDD
ncbi:MAG: hypothetical protein ACRENE_03360 [Polyangiaceae bacterium]